MEVVTINGSRFELPEIERDILHRIASRLCVGLSTYGAFEDLDDRDFIEEAHQEVEDGLVYSARAMQRIQNWRARQRGDEPTVDFKAGGE